MEVEGVVFGDCEVYVGFGGEGRFGFDDLCIVICDDVFDVFYGCDWVLIGGFDGFFVVVVGDDWVLVVCLNGFVVGDVWVVM